VNSLEITTKLLDRIVARSHLYRIFTLLSSLGAEPALNNGAYIDGAVVKHNSRFRDHFMSYVDDLLHEVTHAGIAG